MKTPAPYQIFFPIGVLSSLLAVGVWFVQSLNWFSTPALLIHSKLIVGGFIWSFIVGFLMTALPRMTGTVGARSWELMVAGVLILSQIFSSWNIDGRWFYGTNILLIGFLIIFGGQRFFRKTKLVPIFFSHVVVALMLGIVGSIYHFQGNSYMGIHLYHVGTILLLILGIGTRFFSFLSGLPSLFEIGPTRTVQFLFTAPALLVALFLFLAGLGHSIAYFGLTLVTLFYLFFIWKVQRPSKHPSALKHGVRVVATMIPLSFFMCGLQPALYITWLHLLFIGCFALLTYAVGTRVILAHGSYPLNLETKTPALWVFVVLLGLSIAARILYGFADGLWRTSFLHSAATLWTLAIAFWCYAFLGKIFRSGDQAKPSC